MALQLRPQTRRTRATRSQRVWNDRPLAPTLQTPADGPTLREKSWWLDCSPETFTAVARTRRYVNLRPHHRE